MSYYCEKAGEIVESSKLYEGNKVNLPQFLMVTEQHDRTQTKITLPVMSDSGIKNLTLTEQDLSKHILSLGGIGSGKTNLINLLVSQIITNLTAEDVVVIFDTKGDFFRKFAQPDDIVFGNLTNLPAGVECAKWNIFKDIMIDPSHTTENLLEVCKSLFLERALHNTNPFFPNAARDLLYGYMLAKIRGNNPSELNNKSLARYFQSLNIENLRSILNAHDDLKSCVYYIEGSNLQTQGVISEVVQLVREIFVDQFAQEGMTSIREAVRNKNKKIFIEYDLGLGNMLTPVYRILLDMVIKEALCRDANHGNVYVIIDEFSLLPNLQHISDGVNFGRELGIKFLVGLQNIEQLYTAYGEHAAGSILSGFNTRFFFKVNDTVSRLYVQDLLGHNRIITKFQPSDRRNGLKEDIAIGNVLEDWVYEKLPIGTAVFYQNGTTAEIIGLPEFQGHGRPPINKFVICNETDHHGTASTEKPTSGFKRLT